MNRISTHDTLALARVERQRRADDTYPEMGTKRVPGLADGWYEVELPQKVSSVPVRGGR